jgi:hypothetical protein
MKNKLGFIAILAIIGFLAACSNGDNPTVEHEHQWGGWAVTKAATCTAKGEETRVCTIDPSHKETREIAIDPDEHDWEQLEGTAPTCTTEGNGKRKCKLCGVEESGVFPALGHDWGEWVETKAPTDTEDGQEERTCGNDATHKETKAKAALNHTHDWGNWFTNTPATCTAKGESKRVCTLNSNHFETEEINALGHDWGNWIETTPASYIADGIETRICNHDSSHFETRPIPQIPLVIERNLNGGLKRVLDDLPDNDPANPYKIKLIQSKINFSSSGGNMYQILSSTKYFSLDISDSSFSSDHVDYGAFYNCPSLTSVTLNNCSFESDGTFQDCTGLTSVTIGSGVTSSGVASFGDCTFWGCTSLTSVTIGNDVSIIGNSAFTGCTSLTNITIPNSVNSIGQNAFMNCTSLTSITFATGSNIPDANFGNNVSPEGSTGTGGNTLKTAYNAASPKAGTYTRSANGSTWSKQP